MTYARVSIQTEDFDLSHEIAELRRNDKGVGAVCSFVGTVRDRNEGDAVASMELEHYPGMTEKSIEAMVQEAFRRFDIFGARVIHRVGLLQPLDQIVLVAVTSAHRGQSFQACEFVMQRLRRGGGRDRKPPHPAHRAGIEPFLHLHHHHGGFRVAGHDGALDGCRTPPAGQGGAMEIEAAQWHRFQHRHGEDQPIGHDDRRIRAEACEFGLRLRVAQAFRREHGKAEALRRLMHRRFHEIEPPPPARRRRAGIDRDHLMALPQDFRQRGHCESWRAHEDQAQAHASSSRLAALANFLITRSRFSFER